MTRAAQDPWGQNVSFFIRFSAFFMWRTLAFICLAPASASQCSTAIEADGEETGVRLLQHHAAALPSGACGAGQGRPAPGAPCLPCAEGTWSTDGTCTACTAGTWSGQRGAESPTTCEKCPMGTWSSQVGATALQAGIKTRSISRRVASGALLSLTTTPIHFCNVEEHSTEQFFFLLFAFCPQACMLCPPGTWSNETGLGGVLLSTSDVTLLDH